MSDGQASLLSVLILARNEAENLRTLLPDLQAVLEAAGVAYEAIVVDADSPDGTSDAAVRAGATVVQQTMPGYANALRQGLAMCRGDRVLTVDADLSHRPEFVGELLAALDDADIAIASRYVPGGSADMPGSRRFLSWVMNRTFALALGLQVRDLSSGYRVYRKTVLDRIEPQGAHFDVLPEIVAQAALAGFRVVEVPFHYHPREAGISKARVLHFAPSYVRTLFRCMIRRAARASDRAAPAAKRS